MIVKEDFLKKLRSTFNLNIYEAKIWTALLSRGLASAGELADMSGVPRSRSYDVLESLEKRGFVIIKLGKPIKYLAVHPAEVVKRVKHSIKNDSETQISMLDDIKETNTFKELELLHKQGIITVDPGSLSGAVKGRHNLRGHIANLLENAEKTVSIMTTDSGFVRKSEEFMDLFKKLNQRNVDIKIIAPINSEEAKKKAQEIREFAKIKNTASIQARFMIIDNDVMFMIENDNKVHESYDIGIWVKTPYFATALKQMFEEVWNKK